MKKILLLLSLTGFTHFTNAQSVKFGVKAGLNFSNETVSYIGTSVTSDTHTGFHIGVIADIPLSNFSIQPGLLYSVKGVTNGTLSYIEVPVNLLYHIKLGANKICLGGGPYLGYGISGSNGLSFGSSSDKAANPDYGLNILGEFRTNAGVFFSAGYGFGLANIVNDGNGITDKNKVASVSVGYFF